MAKDYSKSLDAPLASGIKQAWVLGATYGSFQLIIYGSFAVALVYGAFRVAAGAYTGERLGRGQLIRCVLYSQLSHHRCMCRLMRCLAHLCGTGGTVLNVLMSVLLGGFAIMQGAPAIPYLIKVSPWQLPSTHLGLCGGSGG